MSHSDIVINLKNIGILEVQSLTMFDIFSKLFESDLEQIIQNIFLSLDPLTLKSCRQDALTTNEGNVDQSLENLPASHHCV